MITSLRAQGLGVNLNVNVNVKEFVKTILAGTMIMTVFMALLYIAEGSSSTERESSAIQYVALTLLFPLVGLLFVPAIWLAIWLARRKLK